MAPRVPLAEVVSVGDELLQGWNVDTNAGEIARALLPAGVRVVRFSTGSDERAALRDLLLDASRRADFIIITGGLGPTDDDLTREAAADALGVDLEFVSSAWESIERRFKKRGVPIPESNRRQAFRPRGAETIVNDRGTAPGFALTLGRARVYALPGVPHEMRAMMENFVLPSIRVAAPDAAPWERRVLKCFGASEAYVGERIAPWMGRTSNPLVGITVSRGVHTISILAQAEGASPKSGAQLADGTADAIAALLGDLVFARDDRTLESILSELLQSKGATVAFAESCTGGLASALLTSVPGASAAFRASYVTYANEAKTEMLGVPSSLLAGHGAVSAECAAAMAAGAAARSGADIAVAITGIAGPDGGTEEKPVGLVWFGVCRRGAVRTFERRWTGLERNLIREIAAREALNAARLEINSIIVEERQGTPENRRPS